MRPVPEHRGSEGRAELSWPESWTGGIKRCKKKWVKRAKYIFRATVSLPSLRGDADVGLRRLAHGVSPRSIPALCGGDHGHSGTGLGVPRSAEEEVWGHPLTVEGRAMRGRVPNCGGNVAKRRFSPQPGAPGHRILPLGRWDFFYYYYYLLIFILFFSDLLCQAPSPRPGEEVHLATAGRDTMNQLRRGTKNN